MPNKRRHLDGVLESTAEVMLNEFKAKDDMNNKDELLRLYDRVIDLEEEVRSCNLLCKNICFIFCY